MTSALKGQPNNKADMHSPEFWEDINRYQNNLAEKQLPIIYTVHHLCLLAKVNITDILDLCHGNRIKQYKRFKLRKKRGGFRVIHTPIPQIKYLQRWILYNILNQIPSHSSCKGFDKGQSIKSNSQEHVNSKAILKFDLLRFYDSINERRIYGLFRSLGYHSNLSVYLAKICTVKPDALFLLSFKKSEQELKVSITSRNEGVLPQGAPTSPKIANLIAMRLDNRLATLANKNGIKYSRYADDLTFSGTSEQIGLIKKVVPRIVRDSNFYLNFRKTKLLKPGAPFFVTGLSVNGIEPKIPRKFKTDIEHHLYHCLKNGVIPHLQTCNIQNSNYKEWLLGKIAFVKSIELETGLKYFNLFNQIVWPI